MIYGGTVIDKLLSRQPFEPAEVSAQRDAWYAEYIRTGGLAHIMLVLERGLPRERHSAPWQFVMRNKGIGLVLRLLIKDHVSALQVNPL